MAFDLYWGSRTLSRFFKDRDAYKSCLLYNSYKYPKGIWTEQHLWSDFERYLAELNREKVLMILDFYLAQCDTDEEVFRYADYFFAY